MDVNLSESASDTEFDGDVNVKVDDDATIAFTDVEFGKKALLNISGAEQVKGKKTLVRMFQWEKSSSTYKQVTDDDEDNLTPANAKSEGVEITQGLRNRSTWNLCDTWAELVTNNPNISWVEKEGKFHCDPIDAAKEALNNSDGKSGSEQIYKQLVADKGAAVANADPALANYQKDWEKLYGTAKKVETTKDGKDIAVVFTAYTDKEINDDWTLQNRTDMGELRYFADENDFVTTANKKIDGCDWFTIYWQNPNGDTVEPEDVIISFTDCTVAGKALTVSKLNDLIDDIDPRFSSAKEAWFKVVLDGEALTWKKAGSSTYILQ